MSLGDLIDAYLKRYDARRRYLRGRWETVATAQEEGEE